MLTTYVCTLLSIVPVVAYGADVAAPTDFKGVVGILVGLIKLVVVVVFALTFIAVVWGIIKGWILNSGEAEGVEEGKKIVLAGIIALVVMTSVWAILALFKSSIFGN